MADTVPARSVYRYFDLADSFVQIVVTDAEALALAETPALDRAGYRRMVLEACMPSLEGDAPSALETLFPDDPLLVEDLLYQLCIEVNPGLDIHEVRLRVRDEVFSEGDRQKKASASTASDESRADLLSRLRHASHDLESRLARRIFGQDQALTAVSRCVRRAAAGLAPEERPLASLLFTGRTGTGKTELARVLADELFGSEAGLVRIDCSEFGLPHEYSKLIGSPPGYVGHDEGGQLTEALSRSPHSVVLFDEIEKAHPRFHALLLQILEEGALTDGKGQRVRLDGCIVILTSNAGAEEIQNASRSVGFGGAGALGEAHVEEITGDALSRLFRPELLGRLDETIVFRQLDLETAEQIAGELLYRLACRTRLSGGRVAFTPAVARWVARRGFEPASGARELRRVIQREVEPPLSDMLIDGAIDRGELIRVRVRRDALVLEREA